jgi:alanine transaminase
MVIINPGNPTGQLLSEETISKIVEFAYNNGICILADEVYQENVYTDTKKFVSFKKVVATMPEPYNNTELISFHSTSKGILGECGIRGGYFEWFNLDPDVENQIQKLKTIRLCANTNGQILTDLMVRPPTEAENGKEVTERFRKETSEITSSMKRRSKIVYDAVSKMKGVTCNEAEGAMYAFPRIHLSKKAIQEAKTLNLAPDLFYTLEALKQTGICTVQGSGFRQKEDEYHFRITTLVTPDEKLERKMESFRKFNDKFMDKYA